MKKLIIILLLSLILVGTVSAGLFDGFGFFSRTQYDQRITSTNMRVSEGPLVGFTDGQQYRFELQGVTSDYSGGKIDLKIIGPKGEQREVIASWETVTFSRIGSKKIEVSIGAVHDNDGVENDRAHVRYRFK